MPGFPQLLLYDLGNFGPAVLGRQLQGDVGLLQGAGWSKGAFLD
jgi:hypothetical protein